MKKLAFYLAVGLPLCLLLAVLAYYLPPIHEHLAWRVDEELLRIRYTLHPPEQVIFVPQETVYATPTRRPSPSPTEVPPTSDVPTHVAPSPSPTALPTATPLPLPAQALIQNVPYEDQHNRYNYCAPANLAMALSFWGWQGNRDTVGPYLKPDAKDKNVMPYEMVNYIQDHTDLRVAYRVAGDLDLLKRFVAAGFPVLIEKGTYLRDLTGVVSWMGHYEVVIGYDDSGSFFITQDSYIGPNYKVSYDDMVSNWRAFDYTYLIIYPAQKEADVMQLLGPDADENYNYNHAYKKASQEIYQTSGIDQFFAWFNRGSSLVDLQDYAGAAAAYDQAFGTVYPTIPDKKRPWRMLWYQTGPYFAYFYSGRYNDVVTLANNTLDAMQSDKNLEESYYWRGMAELALGDQKSAVDDFQTSIKFHKGFGPSVYELKQLGIVS